MAQLYSVYLDESGIHEGAGAVTVAGFVSNVKKWEAFSKDWKYALDKWNIPMFHMTDFENNQGYFSSWTDEEHKERLNHLLGLIKPGLYI
jgi:hypothetical protein